MNLFITIHGKLRLTILFGIALTMTLLSCNKSDFQALQGECEVRVSLETFSFETDDASKKNSAKGTQRKSLMIDGHQLAVELIPITPVSALSARSTPLKAAVTDKLKIGVKYRVIVYDKNGNYKDTKVYTVGSESTESAFQLDGGLEYRFVAVSYGNTNVPPAPSSTVKLNAAEITNISSTVTNKNALLYANVPFTPRSGSNKLSLVLKNLLSEVNVRIDASNIGIIQGATASLSGIYSSIQSLKLNDGSITPGVTSQGRSFSFPVLQQAVVSSDPGIMYTGNSPSVNFKSTVTIDGVEKAITLNGFQVLPGYKYNLNITFLSSGVVIGNQIWAKGNLSYANGIYFNRSSPEQTGYDYRATDYWNYGSPEIPLLPAMNTTFQAETPSIIFPINDPCALIGSGEWRMPTLADFAALGPPKVVDANGTEGGILNGYQPNGVGSSATGTREIAGYIYFQGTDEISGSPLRLKFFAGGGLKGSVINNIPAYEPDISTFRNFDVVYHAIDSQQPSTGTGLHGVPNELKGYVYAPPIFLSLNENTDQKFNFLSHRFVHTASENSVIWPRRDSRFPIRCVKDK